MDQKFLLELQKLDQEYILYMDKIKSFVEYISEDKNQPLPSVTGPTVHINADYKSGQSLPNWKGLKDEEKNFSGIKVL